MDKIKGKFVGFKTKKCYRELTLGVGHDEAMIMLISPKSSRVNSSGHRPLNFLRDAPVAVTPQNADVLARSRVMRCRKVVRNNQGYFQRF